MKENLAFYVVDAARLLRKRFDAAARAFSVTGAQWRVLGCIHRFPGINQGQIAEQLEVEPITTCRMLDRLEQAGLVERRRNPEDRRAWHIHLTDAALPLLDEVRSISDALLSRAVAGFSAEEREQLGAMLQRVRANLLDDEAFDLQERDHG